MKDAKNTMKNKLLIFISVVVLLNLNGCAINQPQHNSINNKETLTLGTIQKHIKKGVSQSEVITILGPPNIITNDRDKETWVYDKISTVMSTNEAQASAGGVGVGGSALGFLGVSGKHSNSSTSQKTLTVIIKFNNSNIVDDVSYHSSKY